jgi:hypothetical protein
MASGDPTKYLKGGNRFVDGGGSNRKTLDRPL